MAYPWLGLVRRIPRLRQPTCRTDSPCPGTRCALVRGFLLVGLATLAPEVAHADVLGNIRAANRVRVAIASGVPPFNDFDAQRKLVGSDVETAELLAQDLKVRLELVPITNAERIPVLLERRADLVISALSITPEREREIAFSVPYAQITIIIAAPAPLTLSSMRDLNGRRVGALAHSSNLGHLLAKAPGARVAQYQDNDKMSIGYLAGEFEVMTAPESVVKATNALNPPQPLQVQFTQIVFDVAIGMNHSEKGLRDWINAWVVANLRNGRLSDIHRRYHGTPLPQSILPTYESMRKP